MIPSHTLATPALPFSLPEHYSHRHLDCDVFVAGGGMSGVSCALASARQGMRVILCQDRPVLGGNASSEVRMHIVGANFERPCRDLKLEPRESGIIEEIRLENAVRNPQRSPSMLDFILYEKCRSEPTLTLLLNTSVTTAHISDDAATTKRRITSVEALRPSTEDRFTIKADIFVDCTGDGGLGVAAGAAFFRGREDQASFDEVNAREVADSKTLGSTLLFMARKHDKPMPFIPPPWARKFTEEDLELRPHADGGVDRGLEYGYWWMEWGGQLDTIKENEEIRDELLAILMGVWDHIKNQPGHGAENWALEWFGFLPGKRESRRFVGQHVLTENDVMQSRPFEDAIAYGGWPIDTHPPEGVDRPQEPPCIQAPVPMLYDIPLRSCIARDFSNLLFAGRNISATHLAFASTRVMATCSLVGQGVGTAAAYAITHGLPPSDLPADSKHLRAIQQQLLRQDAYLVGLTLSDSEDLVRQARISASTETPEGPAQNILSGQNRCVLGERGAPADRQLPGTHRWISDSSQSSRQWLQFDWEASINAGKLAIVFDTGLHRHLTLTQSEAYAQGMYWGTGQPETVKHFRVEGLNAQGSWELITEVDHNYQRLWTYQLREAAKISALRITFLETWAESLPSTDTIKDPFEGQPNIRIIRVSVYPE